MWEDFQGAYKISHMRPTLLFVCVGGGDKLKICEAFLMLRKNKELSYTKEQERYAIHIEYFILFIFGSYFISFIFQQYILNMHPHPLKWR